MEASIKKIQRGVCTVVEEEVVTLTLTRREAEALKVLADLHENGVYSFYATEGKTHFGGALFGAKLHDIGIRSDCELEQAAEKYGNGSGMSFNDAVADLKFDS